MVGALGDPVCSDPQVSHWLAPAMLHCKEAVEATASVGANPGVVLPEADGGLAKRPAKNAWLWPPGKSSLALSDTILRVVHLPSAKGETAEQLEAKKQQATHKEEYRLHSVVLAAGSTYFRSCLLSGQAEAQPAKGDAQLFLIEEELAPSEMSAGLAVLRHMYTEELVYDSPAHLVSILKVADKWGVEDTIESCRRVLLQLPEEAWGLDVIKQVYSLEGIMRDVMNFADLVTTVQARLVTMFMDVVEIVQNPPTRQLFLQLPFAAVVSLLRSPQLVIDSEDSVVVAANLWVVAGKGRNTTAEQRRYLAGAINLSGLSPAYLCGVLPNLRWFTPAGQPLVSWTQAMPVGYFAELQARLVSSKAKQVLSANSSSSSAPQAVQPTTTTGSDLAVSPAARAPSSSHLVPAKAPAPPAANTNGQGLDRPSSLALPSVPVAAAGRVVRDQNLEIECDIEFERLKQYLEDGHAGLVNGVQGFKGVHVHSQCSYFKGFMWGIKLVFGFSAGHASDGSAPAFTVTPSPFASLPPGEEGMRPLVTPINVSFRCTMEAVAGDKAATYASATYQGASFLRPGEEHVSSIGIANFFKRVPQPQQPESWLPYLVDGKLRLRLRVVGGSVE